MLHHPRKLNRKFKIRCKLINVRHIKYIFFISSNLNVRSSICGPAFNCGASTSQNCQSIIERYEEHSRRDLEPLEKTNDEDEHQTLKHIVLLIILLCSMFVVSF